MAKDQATPETVADATKDGKARNTDTSVEGVTFESPVPVQENLGPVSEEKAKEVNGYKGHKNIASKVKEDQEAKGRNRDDETSTGAKFF